MSSTRLDEQTALIVGASSGMGRAIAIALARDGAHVVAAARRAKRLDELAQQVREEGGSIETCAMDATKPDEVQRAVELAARRTGRIDLLV
jgi:serine 3-dehydrogenase (NADP+)